MNIKEKIVTIKKSKIFQYGNFLSINVIVYLLTFVKGILTRRFVDPADYGIYVEANLLLTYGSYMQLGVFNALYFELPGVIAKKEQETIEKIIGSSLGYTLVISIFSVLLIPVLGYMDFEPYLKYGYILVTIALVESLLTNAIQNIYRGFQNYNKLSWILTLSVIIDLGCTILVTRRIGYWGLYSGLLLSYLVIIIFTYKEIRKYKLLFSIREFKNRIKVGFPLFVVGMLWSLIISSAQTVAIYLLNDSEQIGIFSISVMAYSAIMVIPTVISQIVYPKILILISTESNSVKLKKFYETFMKYYIPIVALITGAMYTIIPWFIKLVLPQYTAGVPATKIIILSTMFLAPNSIACNVITGVKKSNRIIKNLLIVLSIVVLTELFLVPKTGIVGISICLIAGFGIYYFLNSRIAIQILESSAQKHYTRYMLSIVGILVPIVTGDFLGGAIVGIFVLGIYMIGFMLWALREKDNLKNILR